MPAYEVCISRLIRYSKDFIFFYDSLIEGCCLKGSWLNVMEYCVTDADGYIHEHGTLLSVTDDNTLAYADDEFIYIF